MPEPTPSWHSRQWPCCPSWMTAQRRASRHTSGHWRLVHRPCWINIKNLATYTKENLQVTPRSAPNSVVLKTQRKIRHDWGSAASDTVRRISAAVAAGAPSDTLETTAKTRFECCARAHANTIVMPRLGIRCNEKYLGARCLYKGWKLAEEQLYLAEVTLRSGAPVQEIRGTAEAAKSAETYCGGCESVVLPSAGTPQASPATADLRQPRESNRSVGESARKNSRLP